MATTATNKQPLLVDRVLHNVIDLNNVMVPAIDIQGSNTAGVLVNGQSSDGAVIEYIYVIGRGEGTGEKINLYMSSAIDYLRQNEAQLVAQMTFTETEGEVTECPSLPKIVAPMPHTGDDAQFRALYLPRGKSLWVARQSTTVLTKGPLIGAQGGWY